MRSARWASMLVFSGQTHFFPQRSGQLKLLLVQHGGDSLAGRAPLQVRDVAPQRFLPPAFCPNTQSALCTFNTDFIHKLVF